MEGNRCTSPISKAQVSARISPTPRMLCNLDCILDCLAERQRVARHAKHREPFVCQV
jgi:hypothetical protein